MQTTTLPAHITAAIGQFLRKDYRVVTHHALNDDESVVVLSTFMVTLVILVVGGVAIQKPLYKVNGNNHLAVCLAFNEGFLAGSLRSTVVSTS